MKINFAPVPSWLISSNGLRRGGRTGPTLRRAGLLALTVGLPHLTAAEDGIFRANFEAPAYQLDSIHGQQGWSVEQGHAVVKAREGRNGSAGLVLEPSAPFSQATLVLAAPAQSSGPGFLDFHVAPAATDESRLEEMLDIDSARIGFFRSLDQPSVGRVWFFSGDGAGGGSWRPTSVTQALDPSSGRAVDWIRLTIRQDFAARTWDLWVNGRLAVAGAGFQELAGDHTGSYVILGDAVERLVLDDLSIGGPNPLGEDADADGMLDSEEVILGSNPQVPDREGKDGFGRSYLDKWVQAQNAGQTVSSGVPAAPAFSRQSAVVGEAFSLSLTSAGASAIYYTLDGTNPVPPSALTYSGPIPVSTTTVVRAAAADDRGRLSKTVAAGWVFPDAVPQQQKPAGWPDFLQEANAVSGGLSQFPLGVSLDGANVAGVVAALKEAPVVILSLPPEDLFGANGIYFKSTETSLKARGEVIWMDPRTGVSGGASSAGFTISGQSSRKHEVTLKHSIRVSLPAASEGGPVFGTSTFPMTQFLLRHPTQDSWAVNGSSEALRKGARYIASAWASQWLADAGRAALKQQWVHLFLNGTYWGVYEALEQHDSVYANRHPGAGSERHLLESAPSVGRGAVKSILGSADAWSALVVQLQQLASGGERTTDAAWMNTASNLDVPGLADYVLWNWWLQTAEWPVKNWLVSWESGQWKFFSWDAERAMPETTPTLVTERFISDGAGPAAVFSALCQWPRFRSLVADRFSQLAAAGGNLHPNVLRASLEKAASNFAALSPAEAARWGGAYITPTATPADWLSALKTLKEGYLEKRTEEMGRELTTWLVIQEISGKRNPAPGEEDSTQPPISAGEGFPFAGWADLDSDGDGIPDYWERLMGFDPIKADDAHEDPDGDNVSNLEEFLRKSDARRPNKVPLLDFNSPGLHNRFSVPTRRRVLPAVR